MAPLMTGLIADAFRRVNNPRPRESAILIICITAWLLCGLIYFIAAHFISGDIETLRTQMEVRAKEQK